MNDNYANPNALDHAAALELFRSESNLQATALPATATPIDTPTGKIYDRSNVIGAARHALGVALHDASLIRK